MSNDLLPGELIACVAASPSPSPDPAVVLTQASAMEEDRFWGLIESLNGSTDDDQIDELVDELTALSLSDLVAFNARLTLALYSLDSGCRAEWYRVNEPAQLGFVSDDVFLYARADTVAAGRDVWTTAVAEDSLPWGTVDPTTGNGEFLLYAADFAAEAAGLDLDEFYERSDEAIKISYETGSNPAGWD